MNKLIFGILLLFSTILMANAIKGKKEVLIDNEKVQVKRLTYPPGTESGMHTHAHPHRVIYVIKGGTITLVPEDANKETKTLQVKEGMALFVPKQSHNVKNVGTTEVILLETEIKQQKGVLNEPNQ